MNKILKDFEYKRVNYTTRRKLKGNEFNAIELEMLERQGFISVDKPEEKTTKSKAKAKSDDHKGQDSA